MKKLFSLMVYFFLSMSLFSQSEIIQQQDTATYTFCDVLTSSKVMSNLNESYNVNVFIDFGNGVIISPDNPLIDKTGKKIIFTSTPDVLNYLSKEKWILICSTSLASKGNWNFERIVSHFILKKKKY